MRRPVLLTIMTLGLIITLLGATGIVAVFTDTADTGNSSVASGERARSADIQLGVYDIFSQTCVSYANSRTTGFYSFSNSQPESSFSSSGGDYFCIRNVGSESVTLSVSTFDLVDAELACSNEEPGVDPDGSTCGTVGELSQFLTARFDEITCSNGSSMLAPADGGVSTMQSTPVGLGTLSSGSERCFNPLVRYQTANSTEATLSQTDQATWKFRFSGSTAA